MSRASQDNRPQGALAKASYRRGDCAPDAADDDAIGKHVVSIILPLAPRHGSIDARFGLFDLNGEANSVRKKQSSATMEADVKRFAHQINTDEVFDTHTVLEIRLSAAIL